MNKELKLGTIFLLFSGFLWFYAIPYHIKGSTQALYPRCLTIAMLIPCILLIINGVKAYKAGVRHESFSIITPASLRALLMVPLMLAYIFIIDIIGFYITTCIFVFIFLLFFGVRKWLPLVIYPIVIPAVVHVVIYEFLSFPFPEGVLF